jgi:hypothetical protein
MGKGVGHAGIKKIVPGMGDQSPSFTFGPCGKAKGQKCVFENLVALLNGLDRYSSEKSFGGANQNINLWG